MKTKELIIYRSRFDGNIPPCLTDIELIRDSKLLGVQIDNRLTFGNHVATILSACSQRFYVLKLLKNQGMPLSCLSDVFDSIIVGKITYCISAWGGFLKESDVNKINSIFKKGKCYGYTDTRHDMKGLMHHFDSALFNKMRANEEHCLHQILPLSQNNDKNLRARGHDYALPMCLTSSYKTSFLPRCLSSFV